MANTDCIKKFLLQDRGARVIASDLQQVWQTAQTHQPEHMGVRTLMGELMAAATLLTANLKFDGSLLLQMQGNGPIKLIVVECRQDLSIRATVKLSQTPQPEQVGLQRLLNPDGLGRFSVILNPPRDVAGRQPYQGIVPLTADSVAGVLEDYMAQSEQLETRIWLDASSSRATGLLLQRMPEDGGQSTVSAERMGDSWHHALALCDTIDANELASVSSETLLHRLFWETPVVGLEESTVSWHCGCNRDRVADMLRSLGKAEVQDIISEQGRIEVICDFCGTPYEFDAVDSVALFRPVGELRSDEIH